MTKAATAEKATEEAPTHRRRPRPLDRAVVVQQVTRLALMLRSVALIVENLAMDLQIDLGAEMPEAPPMRELHVAPKGPEGATVHRSNGELWDELGTSSTSSSPASAAVLSNPTPASTSSSSPLRKGARHILAVLANVGAPLTRVRLATLAGFSVSSGTFSGYLSTLRTSGFIDAVGEKIMATPKGRSEIGHAKTSNASDAQVRAMWTSKLRAGARKILESLRSMHPRGLTRVQLATLSGFSPASGTFSGYLSTLRSNALIADDGKRVALTSEGLIVAGGAVRPLTNASILSLWSSVLRAGARKMLEALCAAHPNDLSYEQLGHAAGIGFDSGTFSGYLSTLRSNGLIETQLRRASASDEMFVGGAS